MEYGSETASAFAAIWQSGVADYIDAQSEFSLALQNSNQHWLGRIQSMAELGSAFASKLIAARSPLDAFAAWQDWAAQWVKISAENWQQLFSDGQKIGELESRLVATVDAADE
jgi:hypothetical protein